LYDYTIGIRGIGDNDIVLVHLVLQEFDTITNVDLDVGVFETNGHVGKVLLGHTGHGFVDIHKDSFFNTFMLDDFTEDTTITATDNENLYGKFDPNESIAYTPSLLPQHTFLGLG
jgi:hypothetical protein